MVKCGKKYKKLYEYVDQVCKKIANEQQRQMFRQCYLNTLETTVEWSGEDVFIKTGDIPAMWLRDSSVQVSHYVRLVGIDNDVDELIKSTIKRQLEYILIDAYANAFNKEANKNGHKDITQQNDNVWERKYEIDSLVYPLWLICNYYKHKQDKNIFDKTFFSAFSKIVEVFILEQNHNTQSTYGFIRTDENWNDTLPNDGKGGDCAYTGMTWSAFRPSDDRCQYHYLVPSNMFAVAVLKDISKIIKSLNLTNPIEGKCNKLIEEIEAGISKYAIVKTEKFGKIYAYEVDGMGNVLLMDDANVPSLMSLPYLNYCDKNEVIYQQTRAFILSKSNPYYYSGKLASGVGSPHTPQGYIWHIALIMQALTSTSEEEINKIYQYLCLTHAGTQFMHESFDCNDDKAFTRPWFAWANTLYAIFIIDCIVGKQQ